MPRHDRLDYPGAAHHVFNRGLARRTAFESEDDIRYALSLFAREVHAARLRLVSYSFLTTHFHALVETPGGDLSKVMQRVMNLYVRRFNRRRERDGPLFRGRFGSRLVESESYRVTLVRYIDQNAPQARLAATGPLYPFGSAVHYASLRRPRWLDSSWIDEVLGPLEPSERLDRYSAWFGGLLSESELALVQERMIGPTTARDPLDNLVHAAPHEVREWMTRKALLADGTRPGIACAGRDVVKVRVAALSEQRGPWMLKRPRGHRHDVWPVLCAGLLRHVAALPFVEIGSSMGISREQAMRLNSVHKSWLEASPDYADAAAGVVLACVEDLPHARRLLHNAAGLAKM